jgi:tetratricopeptide (TPR) repeat protein
VAASSSALALALLLALGSTQERTVDAGSREARWSADLDALAAELARRHANLHHTLSPTQFSAGIERVRTSISQLSDVGMMIEIARLLARVGDGHTGYFLPWDRANNFRRYPLELWMGKDGPIVIAAAPAHASLVGARLTRIGARQVVDVVEAIRPLLPFDNPHGANGLLPSYLVLPELLHGLGLAGNMERVQFEGEIPGKGRVRATLMPVPASGGPQLEAGAFRDRLPAWIARRGDPYWFERLADGTLFVQYNDASLDKKEEPFTAFVARVERAAREHPFERLVVDLRWNDGGSFRRARPLLHALIRLEDALPEGKLFVVTSPRTFSAAALLATDIDLHTSALFVGEPTGGKPNSYGELRRFRLPGSGIEIRYAAWYYQQSTPDDRRPAIFPDLVGELTAEAFQRGEDPAIRAIRAYRPRTPISEVVRRRLVAEGVAAAIREYRELKTARFNEHCFDEKELETLGRELAEKEKGQLEAAIALLELNLEEFPWSAQSHFVLGDAYARASRCADARREYETAFQFDRSYPTSAERLTRLKLCGASTNQK